MLGERDLYISNIKITLKDTFVVLEDTVSNNLVV